MSKSSTTTNKTYTLEQIKAMGAKLLKEQPSKQRSIKLAVEKVALDTCAEHMFSVSRVSVNLVRLDGTLYGSNAYIVTLGKVEFETRKRKADKVLIRLRDKTNPKRYVVKKDKDGNDLKGTMGKFVIYTDHNGAIVCKPITRNAALGGMSIISKDNAVDFGYVQNSAYPVSNGKGWQDPEPLQVKDYSGLFNHAASIWQFVTDSPISEPLPITPL